MGEQLRIDCFDDRKDFYCLRSNWFQFVDFSRNGQYEYVVVGPRPDLKDGEVMGYHCVIADGKFTRYFLVLTEEEAKQRKYHKPRIFSKYKAVAVLTRQGVWQECRKFIEDAGLYDLYLAATEFSEADPYFVEGLAKIKEKLGLSDEEIERLLEAIVA